MSAIIIKSKLGYLVINKTEFYRPISVEVQRSRLVVKGVHDTILPVDFANADSVLVNDLDFTESTEQDFRTILDELIYKVNYDTIESDDSVSETGATWIFKEIPSGTKDGVNVDFELSELPVLNSEHVFLQGQVQSKLDLEQGYSINNKLIRFVIAPEAHEIIEISYQKGN